MIQEIELKKLSIRHLAIIAKCYGTYGELLATRYDCLKAPQDKKDFSILQELMYETEKHFASKKLAKEENPPKANKKLKLKVHTALVLEEALHWYEKNREAVYDIPYIEGLKEQLNKQLV